jgi:hypothetical protein
MARTRLVVPHFLACTKSRAIRPVGPTNAYVLKGVSHYFSLPRGATFPNEFRRLDFYCRCYHGRGTRDFELEIQWIDGPNGRQRINVYGPFKIRFRPGEPARDWVVRVTGLPVPGEGRYVARLKVLKTTTAKLLAAEYFHVRESR